MNDNFFNKTIILILSILVIVFISGYSKSAAAKTPDKVVETVIQGLSKNEPQILWNVMPESYQKNVHELLSDFAAKMDKDIWNKTFQLIRKIITILETKKDLILTGDMVNKAPVDIKQISENWGSFVSILEIIVKSELGDLEKIRKLDIEKFLAGTVSDQWKEKISEIKKALSEASEKISIEEKQKILGMIKSFDGILDQILAAKTKEDLEPIIGQGIGMLIGRFLGKG